VSLSADLIRRLETLIMAGEWRQGERLPGQRQLAEQLGVSMAAVREALAALAAAGLVEARHGEGTFVCGAGTGPGSVEAWLGPLQGRQDLVEFLAVRRELERYVVREAARHATPEQHERLAQLLSEMRDAQADIERYSQADLAFHMTLAESANNRVLLRVMRALQVSLQRYLVQVNHEHRLRGSLSMALETHARLVNAVVARDGAAAALELEAMITRGLQYWDEETGSETDDAD